MLRRSGIYSLIVILAALWISGCPASPGTKFETTVKKWADAYGGGNVFTLDSFRENLKSLAKSVKTEKDQAELTKALKGHDETAVLKAMAAANIKILALPRRIPNPMDVSGSVIQSLLNAGTYEHFSVLYIDEATILAGPSAEAYRISDKELASVMAYTRAGLSGKPAGSLPSSFSSALLQPGVVDLRFTDPNGYNRNLGRVRGRGKTAKAALDDAIKKAIGRYERKGGGGMTAEPFGTFLESAAVTVNFYKESGLIDLSAGKAPNEISLGLDGLIVRIPNRDKPVFATPDRPRLLRTDNFNKYMEALLKREGLEKDAWKKPGVTLEKFRELAFSERKPGGEVVRLWRGTEWVRVEDLTKDAVLQGFKEGADWLVSSFHEDTRMFDYEYYAVRDSVKKNRYNIIRHGLATLTMIQAYELMKDERYLKTAKLAIEWVLDLVEWEGNMAMFRHKRFDPKYKLGGAGTMLQAMCEYVRFQPVPEWEKPMKGLAEFIMNLQKENGHYRSFYTKPGQKPDDKEVTIYPGEANLALVRMYHLFKDQRYLDTVEKAFQYYSKWFNDTKSPKRKGNLGAFVPWDMSAMMEYYEIVKKPEVAAYAYEMADWILDNWYVFGPKQTYWKDYVGGFHGSKRKTDRPIWNSGVYGEGIASIFQLTKLAQHAEKTPKYRKAAFLTIRFVRQSQYREGSSYFLPAPGNALGCIPANFEMDDCRLDYAYHCLTVNYRALRFFDEADWKAVSELKTW